MVWFGWVLWHINYWRLFNAESSLYIYVYYIYTWFVNTLWRLFNAKSSLYIYIYIRILNIHMICKHFEDNILKLARAFFFCIQLNDFKYCYIAITIKHQSFDDTICCIWPIDRTLSGATTPGRSGPGSYGNTPHFPNLQGWSLTIRLLNVISWTFVGKGLTPRQICSRCILQPWPTGLGMYEFIGESLHGVMVGQLVW